MNPLRKMVYWRRTLKVQREDGSALADWADSGCGSGRVELRIYPKSVSTGHRISMTTLEALELCLAGRMVRDAEAGRMVGIQVPDRSAEDVRGLLGPDVDRWEAILLAKTMEWLGRSCFCPASFALAMACCQMFCADRTHPDTLRALERCVAYLRYVPSARVRITLAGRFSDEWARLTVRWDELEAAFLAECGEGFERSEIGDQTEALLRRILEG